MKQALILFMAVLMGKGLSAQSEPGLATLLTKYYQLKNALVEGNVSKASGYSGELVKVAQKIETSKLEKNGQALYLQLKDKIISDAQSISAASQLDKQRELFSSLSNNMILLGKATKLSAQPVYVDYCPMKKMYWLSEEKIIRNPYYGNAMLSCGSVKETIQ